MANMEKVALWHWQRSSTCLGFARAFLDCSCVPESCSIEKIHMGEKSMHEGAGAPLERASHNSRFLIVASFRRGQGVQLPATAQHGGASRVKNVSGGIHDDEEEIVLL